MKSPKKPLRPAAKGKTARTSPAVSTSAEVTNGTPLVCDCGACDLSFCDCSDMEGSTVAPVVEDTK